MIVGSSPSGTLATIRPIAKLSASWSGRPATSQPIGRNASPATTATSGDQPRDAAHLPLERAQLAARPARESAAIRPSSVCIPVAKTSAVASPPMHARAAEHEVARLEQRPASRRRSSAERKTGCDSPVSVERSTSSAPVEQPRIGGDAVALREQQHVAGDELASRRPACARPSRSTGACCGRKRAQRLDRPLGLALLREREGGVEDDHRQDRAAEHRRTADEGEAGREPEQKRERVGELLRELPRPADAAAPHELVGP